MSTYVGHLQELADQARDKFVQDPRSTGSARYYLQVSTGCCINIAHHIITERDDLTAFTEYIVHFMDQQRGG